MNSRLWKRNILHRLLLVICIATVLTGNGAQAQRKRSTGPRAVGLLEVTPNGRAWLVPIVIMVNGKLYDAAFYRATPLPMSLDGDTVYEAERNGDPVGLFTVTSAKLIKGVYVGLGQWRPNNAPERETAKAPEKPPVDLGEEPPVLRKAKPSGTAETPKRPESAKAPEAKPAEKTEAKPAPKPQPPVESAAEEGARPILRRGKPTQAQPEDEQPPALLTKPGASVTNASAKKDEKVEVFTAISDAGGPEARPYKFELTAEERGKYEKALRTLAYETIRKYAAARPQHKPAAPDRVSEVEFRALDVHYNNEPVIVLSASLPEATPGPRPFQYWVTVAARWDMYNEMHTLLAQVTDTQHLDAYGRLDLIDGVDAEGTGDGELLFRKVTDTGYSYVLYRAGLDQLREVFATAERSF